MHLRYGDLLRLIERMHALPSARGVATESRIKNFSRLDFPRGERVGSGERADYGAAQIVQLLVGFEMLRHRVPPAVIAETVRTEWTQIAKAFASAAAALAGADTDADGGAELLLFDALALHEVGKTIRRGELLTTFEIVTARELASAAGSRGFGRRSATLLDPAAILADAADQMPWLQRAARPKEFLAEVADLARGSSLSRRAGNDSFPIEGWAEEGYQRWRTRSQCCASCRPGPRRRQDHCRLGPRDVYAPPCRTMPDL